MAPVQSSTARAGQVSVKVSEPDKAPPAKAGTVSTEISISALDPDADGDGNVSPLEMEIYMALKKADVDGSGSIGVKELYNVIESLVASKKTNKQMGRIIVALLFIIVLAIGCLFATSMAAGEIIKESKVPDCSDPTVSDDRCAPAGLTHVGVVESYSPAIFQLPTAPTNQLASLKDLSFYIDMTANPAEGGVVEATYKIAGVTKSSATIATFHTTNGFSIKIDSVSQTGDITMAGQVYPVLEEPPATRRQLVENAPEMLDTFTGRQLVEEHGKRRRKLQFGGTFGGALLTSGSFTMMAASGGFRRKLAEVASTEATKRELGFGGTFGGALLTSGSFTMMAASGGF